VRKLIRLDLKVGSKGYERMLKACDTIVKHRQGIQKNTCCCKLFGVNVTKFQERLKFKFVLREKSKKIPSAHKPKKDQGSHCPLRQLQQLLLFLLLLLVALLRRLLNTAKGGSWLHPSIVDGGMDRRVDGMKKTSFHHDHDTLYI
jgi:hypothetical protein